MNTIMTKRVIIGSRSGLLHSKHFVGSDAYMPASVKELLIIFLLSFPTCGPRIAITLRY